MSDLYFRNDIFDEFYRIQRQIDELFGGFPSSIRSVRCGTFPQINIGVTDDTVEVVAFAPGMKPAELDVSIDKGLLTISGERKPLTDDSNSDREVYAQERFAGTFRRVIELPQSVDPDKVQARYVDGCLCVTVKKHESSKPQSITVQ
ncbi:Hsp20/alpha crystallin family protein [Paraburkholderia nemoris]|uniref:Hsp20/alpha crystallin family protein n=1 Tax=Paraburkholderia nemoris TaxID=2793076 RepID=UPI0038BC7705